MSKFWILTRFRNAKTAKEQNGLVPFSPESHDRLLNVKKLELPVWVDLEDLAFWEMITPVRPQAYNTIEYRSPATDATVRALGNSLMIDYLKPSEADTIRILVTNFSYYPIFFTLTPTQLAGRVRIHVGPGSLILEIVEDIREQYKLKVTDIILIHTIQYPLSLDKVGKETLSPSDPNLIHHNLGKQMREVFPNGPSREHLHFVAEVKNSEFTKDKEPPSKAGVPATFYTRGKETGNGILSCRPATACSALPSVLIVEVVGKSVDNLSPDTILVHSLGDYEFAHEWQDIVLKLHEDEVMRATRELWKKCGIELGTSKPLPSSTAAIINGFATL